MRLDYTVTLGGAKTALAPTLITDWQSKHGSNRHCQRGREENYVNTLHYQAVLQTGRDPHALTTVFLMKPVSQSTQCVSIDKFFVSIYHQAKAPAMCD